MIYCKSNSQLQNADKQSLNEQSDMSQELMTELTNKLNHLSEVLDITMEFLKSRGYMEDYEYYLRKELQIRHLLNESNEKTTAFTTNASNTKIKVRRKKPLTKSSKKSGSCQKINKK